MGDALGLPVIAPFLTPGHGVRQGQKTPPYAVRAPAPLHRSKIRADRQVLAGTGRCGWSAATRNASQACQNGPGATIAGGGGYPDMGRPKKNAPRAVLTVFRQPPQKTCPRTVRHCRGHVHQRRRVWGPSVQVDDVTVRPLGQPPVRHPPQTVAQPPVRNVPQVRLVVEALTGSCWEPLGLAPSHAGFASRDEAQAHMRTIRASCLWAAYVATGTYRRLRRRYQPGK